MYPFAKSFFAICGSLIGKLPWFLLGPRLLHIGWFRRAFERWLAEKRENDPSYFDLVASRAAERAVEDMRRGTEREDREKLMENTHSTESSVPTVRSDVFTLVATLGMIAKAASDDVLDTIDSNRRISPAIAYTVYEQFYFLLVHIALRFAFNIAGSDGRDSVQGFLSPRLLFSHIPPYLNARYKPRKMSARFTRDLEEQFLDRLNRSELEYSQEQEYIDIEVSPDGVVVSIKKGVKDQLAERLMNALVHSGLELDSTFSNLVRQAVSRRAANVLPLSALVDDIIEHT